MALRGTCTPSRSWRPKPTLHETLKNKSRFTVTVAGDATFNRDVTITRNLTVNGTINLGDADTDSVVFGADVDSHIIPDDDNTYDLGTSSLRWRDIYTGDLNLSNEGRTNDVDGTWGNYTIQEGESDLFLINNRTGKKYKFLLQEVK